MSELSPIGFSDADVDRALRELAGRVDVGPADGLADAVVVRLRSVTVERRGVRPRPPRVRWRQWQLLRPSPDRRLRPAWIVVAIVALVVASTLAASPRARAAVSDWLGFGGVHISTHASDRVPIPSVPPPVLPGVGAAVSLTEASHLVGFDVLVPRLATLAAPRAVYVGHPPVGGEALLVYPPGPQLPATNLASIGLLLAEFRGQVEGGFFAKVLPEGSRLESVTVNGQPGYWIEGPLHEFFYRNADGTYDQATVRLAGNTLLWTAGNLTLRLESALTKQQALNIAASVR
jgi:hypothetical protein